MGELSIVAFSQPFSGFFGNVLILLNNVLIQRSTKSFGYLLRLKIYFR